MRKKQHTLAAAVLFAMAFPACANPTGATVVTGSATFSTSGSTLTVTGGSGAVIHWQTFNIAAGETTRFVQPGPTSRVLNRVTGGAQSSIFGTLTSNGQVYLINPNGVPFGPTAQVNVGGLIASTLDISNENFLFGSEYKFVATGTTGSIINQGSLNAITTPEASGYVILMGADVQHTGTISARAVGIGAGDPISLGGINGGTLLQGLGVGGAVPFTPEGIIKNPSVRIQGTIAAEYVDISVGGTGLLSFGPGASITVGLQGAPGSFTVQSLVSAAGPYLNLCGITGSGGAACADAAADHVAAFPVTAQLHAHSGSSYAAAYSVGYLVLGTPRGYIEINTLGIINRTLPVFPGESMPTVEQDALDAIRGTKAGVAPVVSYQGDMSTLASLASGPTVTTQSAGPAGVTLNLEKRDPAF